MRENSGMLAPRAVGLSVVIAEHDHGPRERLLEARGDDADDAPVPGLVAQDQDPVALPAFRPDELDGLLVDLVLGPLALAR